MSRMDTVGKQGAGGTGGQARPRAPLDKLILSNTFAPSHTRKRIVPCVHMMSHRGCPISVLPHVCIHRDESAWVSADADARGCRDTGRTRLQRQRRWRV